MSDVEITSSRITLRIRGKGNRVRTVPFESRHALPLRAWAKLRGDDDAGAAFLLARRGVGGAVRGMTVASIDYIVRKTGRAAGLDGVHAHLLRHSAASLALHGGATVVQVRDWLGHSSVLTTCRYLHATEGDRPTTSYVAVR